MSDIDSKLRRLPYPFEAEWKRLLCVFILGQTFGSMLVAWL